MADACIDFRKLMLQEKRKARAKKKEKNSPDVVMGRQSSAAAGTPKSTAINSTTTNNTTAAIDETNNSPFWKLYPPEEDSSFAPFRRSTTHCICENPASIYYTDRFLSPAWQTSLWEWLQQVPDREMLDPSTSTTTKNNNTNTGHRSDTPAQANGKWTQLRHARRRVALWDAAIAPLPEPLAILSQQLGAAGIFGPGDITTTTAENTGADDAKDESQPFVVPNHVLVNEYQAHEGIMAHTDGPAYEPQTATISIGGDVILYFEARPDTGDGGNSDKPTVTVRLQGTGSLVVFSDEAYSDYTHAIRSVASECVPDDCLNTTATAATTKEEIVRGHRISLTFRVLKNH